MPLLLPFELPCSIPSVLMSSVLRPPEGGVALQLYEQGLNTIFLFVAVSVAYGMVRRPLNTKLHFLVAIDRDCSTLYITCMCRALGVFYNVWGTSVLLLLHQYTLGVCSVHVRNTHCQVLRLTYDLACAASGCAACCRLQGSCAVGQTPRLPLVADAASKQLGGDGPSGL